MFPSQFVKVIPLSFILTSCIGIEFDRNVGGVNFSPYVKSIEENSYQARDSCPNHITLSEMKAMLQVVTTKFSRVSTENVGAQDVPYVANNTYFNHACVIARTAELAAIINQENQNKSLSVVVGIRIYDEQSGGTNRTMTEVNVALEAGRIANRIYPETVEGFQLVVHPYFANDSKIAQSALFWMEYLRSRARKRNLKFGVFTHVTTFKLSYFQHYMTDEIHTAHPRTKLLDQSDFVAFKLLPNQEMKTKDPIETFSFISRLLNLYDMAMQDDEDGRFDIRGYTGWPSTGNTKHQTIEHMQAYLRMFNDIKSRKGYSFWLNEAFDNPWRATLGEDSSHYGWWKLAKGKQVNDTSAYLEKVLELKDNLTNASTDPLTTSSWIWIYWSVGITVVVLIVLVGFVVYVNAKVHSLQTVLTKEEIKEFKLGFSITDQIMPVQDIELYSGTELVMRKPYDQTLEIPKEKLEIQWKNVLGTGQFGSVHKAIINGTISKDVALKTTKIGCTATALRGLLSEIKILTHLRHHPNIVSIEGAYTVEIARGTVYVALELCDIGSLKNHLCKVHARVNAVGLVKDEADVYIHDSLLRWSYEIAAGMEHIAQRGVIHADLATRNVLLTSDYTAKVADFGLSRRLYEYSEYVKTGNDPLPWRWMAIESLKNHQFSCESDAWSFGVTLWEIFSLGVEPYLGYSYNANFIESLEDGSAIMNTPREAPPDLYQIMLNCWHLRPDMRPSFTDMKARIREIANKDYKYEVMLETNSCSMRSGQ